MNERRWERLGAAGGLVSAVLLLVGIFVTPVSPDVTDAAAIAGYFADNRFVVRFSALLVTLAAVALLWFVGHLRHLLQRAEGGVEAFSPVVLVAGTTLATLMVLTVVPTLALAAMTARPGVATGSAVYALYATYAVSTGAIGLFVALFTATAGAAMVRRELVGPWLGWFGLAAAVIGLICGVVAFFVLGPALMVMAYLISVVFALWIGTASLVMLYRPEVDRAPARRPVFTPLAGHPT